MNLIVVLSGLLYGIQECAAFTYYKNKMLKNTPSDFKSTYERKFAWNYGRESDGFGRAVDIYGDKVIVGTPFSEEDYPDRQQAGSAHIYALKNTQRGWSYESQLWTNQTQAYDFFGWDVGLEQDIAIVGAWQHDDGYTDNGAVYIFQYVEADEKMFWNMTAKVVGKGNNDFLGISVAFPPGAEYALVGAAGAYDDSGNNVGKAYIIGPQEKSWGTSWKIRAALTSSSGSAYDYFGISVSVDSLVAAVGAYGENGGAGDVSGAVYVYSAETSGSYKDWELQTKLLASDGNANDFFGRSVAVSGATIAVGADGTDDSGEKSGSVYVFTRADDSRWSQNQKLVPASDNENEFFGGSVDMSGDLMVVGADGDNHNDVRTGTVYVYQRTHYWDEMGGYAGEYWQMLYQIYATDRSARDLYGSDVAIYENSIIVGAEVGDGYDYNSGAVYVYTTPPDFHWLHQDMSTSAIAGVSAAGAVVLLGLIFFAYRRGAMDSVLQRAGIPKTGGGKLYRSDFDDSRRGPVSAMDTSSSAHSQAPLTGPSTHSMSSSINSDNAPTASKPFYTLTATTSSRTVEMTNSATANPIQQSAASTVTSVTPPAQGNEELLVDTSPASVAAATSVSAASPVASPGLIQAQEATSTSQQPTTTTSALQLSEFGNDSDGEDEFVGASQLTL